MVEPTVFVTPGDYRLVFTVITIMIFIVTIMIVEPTVFVTPEIYWLVNMAMIIIFMIFIVSIVYIIITTII